jgi:hypothetical protein
MDSQLLNIGTLQIIQVPPVDLPSFWLNLLEILQAPCLGQDLEGFLLHFLLTYSGTLNKFTRKIVD